jgi:predicted dehydrogenase
VLQQQLEARMSTNRRRFLSTAGAAVVYKLAGPKPRGKAAGPNDTVGLGFIGSGIRGTQLIDDFKPISAVKMLAVCDLYDGCLARAKEQISPSIATGKDYRAVLDRKDVDAVVIAVPDHLHKKIVLDSLAAGKHVYIEKPMTWSIEEGQAIIAAEKSSGKLVQVGSQGKTSTLTAKTRELIATGAIGKVNMLRLSNHRNNAQGAWKYAIPPDASPETIDWSRFLGDRPKRPFDARAFFQWRCWWEFSGGVATDLFVHLLTWLHEAMNVKAPVSVASFGGIVKWNDGRDVPDVMNSIFEYKEGFIADIYVNLANSYPTPATVIMGSEGTLVVDGRGRLVQYFEPIDHDVQSYGTLQWPSKARAAYFEAKGWQPNGRPKGPLPEPKQPAEVRVERGPSHAEWFISSIREGKPSKENAEEGHYAAGAAHLANMAYRKGKRMRWEIETGKVKEA